MDAFDFLRGAVVGAFSVTTFGLITAIIYYRALRPMMGRDVEPTARVLATLCHLHFAAAVWFTVTFALRFLGGLATIETVDSTVLIALANYLIAYAVLLTPAAILITMLYDLERTG